MLNQKPKLVILTGPTAVGKTDLSIALAKAIHGEIISADSIAVYRKMDIGSAKISKDEMQGIPHYLIDVLDPDQSFNVALFKEYTDKAIQDIYSRGNIPIITGGTGFYIQAVLNNIDFTETNEDGYRLELEKLLEEHDPSYLHNMLKEIDPAAAEAIHMNNTKRVIRALEYYHQTGQKISEHNETERAKESPYNFAYFVLNTDRNTLYNRIEKRIDLMMEQGLLEEVKNVMDEYHLTREHTSMQGLGYKEFFDYFEGKCSLEDAIYILKRDTRHFAKRQLTWFNREKEILWVNKQEFSSDDEILDHMLGKLKEKAIID